MFRIFVTMLFLVDNRYAIHIQIHHNAFKIEWP